MAMFLKKKKDSLFFVQCFGKESEYSTNVFFFFGEKESTPKKGKRKHKIGLQ
jgi:hypothetical protein